MACEYCFPGLFSLMALMETFSVKENGDTGFNYFRRNI